MVLAVLLTWNLCTERFTGGVVCHRRRELGCCKSFSTERLSVCEFFKHKISPSIAIVIVIIDVLIVLRVVGS